MDKKHILRAKIQGYNEAGMTLIDIASKLKVHVNTVYKWIRRDNVADLNRSGRPTKLTPDTKKLITDDLKETQTSSIRKCTKNLNLCSHFTSTDRKISQMTIQRYVKSTDWGKYAYKVKKTFFLSNNNIRDRLYFAMFLLKNGYCDMSLNGTLMRMHVLYTDESWIQLHQAPNRQNMRYRTSNPESIPSFHLPKHPIKIMVAGGICAYGKTELHIVEDKKTVDGKYYRSKILPIYFKTLKDPNVMVDPEMAILMQDGAPAHSCDDSINLIEETIGEYNYWGVGIWPGSSPDLNPIENCWSIHQDCVFVEPRPTNRETLITRVLETWKAIDNTYLFKLVDSIPNRIAELIEKNGHQTSY